MKYKKRIVIDIDGTICDEMPVFEKSISLPKKGSVNFIKKLFNEKYFIILYTSRGWNEYNITKYWLDKYDIKYHILLCGKPIYDIWIDDKAINFYSWDKVGKNIVFKKNKQRKK